MKKLLLTGLLLASASANAKVTVDFWNKTAQPLYFELGTDKYPPAGQENLVSELTAFDPANKSILNRLKRAGTHLAGQASGVNTSVYLYGDYAQVEDWDTSKKTAILLSNKKNIQKGDRAVLITVKPGKDIYLVINENQNGINLFADDNKKYIIKEQSGPQLTKFFGKDITERGLDRKNIAKTADIEIDTNYIVGKKVAQATLSEKEKEILNLTTNDNNPDNQKLTQEEQRKLVESLKGLGIGGDLE